MSSVSRFTGLFRSAGPVALRAHDPDTAVWAGTPANREWPAVDAVGGAGWTDREAELACVGEAIERWQTHPLARDRRITRAFADLAEPAIDPARFVRFSAEQHAQPGFPFERLGAGTECEWVRCRVLGSGAPIWAPADLVFLDMRPGVVPRFGPTISTGWAAHADPQSAARAGVLEAIERDAVVGAWWGRYPLHELPSALDERIARPNLRWRWFRIVTPYSPHVVLATVEGEDREGYAFAIGSACRLDRRAAIDKATLEAVQGRHYARHLIATTAAADPPRSFAEHAAYYSRFPARLAETCLARAERARDDGAPDDSFAAVLARLPPVAIRIATPPALVDYLRTASGGAARLGEAESCARGYSVVRVLVPELQPLHGDHLIPFLGGPLWSRPLADWATIPPHPFA